MILHVAWVVASAVGIVSALLSGQWISAGVWTGILAYATGNLVEEKLRGSRYDIEGGR